MCLVEKIVACNCLKWCSRDMWFERRQLCLRECTSVVLEATIACQLNTPRKRNTPHNLSLQLLFGVCAAWRDCRTSAQSVFGITTRSPIIITSSTIWSLSRCSQNCDMLKGIAACVEGNTVWMCWIRSWESRSLNVAFLTMPHVTALKSCRLLASSFLW